MSTNPQTKPILMSGEMVRAILNGTKTQTRRTIALLDGFEPEIPIKWASVTRPESHPKFGKRGISTSKNVRNYQEHDIAVCPFGQIGDLLWVRETFQGPLVDHTDASALIENRARFESPDYCRYRASGDSAEYYDVHEEETVYRWKPSIHMPRWASRLTLRITDVRVEQLQDIRTADASAEGFDHSNTEAAHDAGWYEKPIRAFRRTWEQLYGEDDWKLNPWVWVIEFEAIHKNIGEALK